MSFSISCVCCEAYVAGGTTTLVLLFILTLMAHTGPFIKVPSDVLFKVSGNRDSKTATGDVEAYVQRTTLPKDIATSLRFDNVSFLHVLFLIIIVLGHAFTAETAYDVSESKITLYAAAIGFNNPDCLRSQRP